MLRGKVQSQGEPPITGEALVDISVANVDDPDRSLAVEVVVDTGFSGQLTLPFAFISYLGLIRRATKSVVLADGESKDIPVYPALVLWNGRFRQILVLEMESQPLLGMELLWGSRLTIDALPYGEVVIAEIPPIT